MKTSFRAKALACALLAGTAYTSFSAAPAPAQSKLISIPADKFVIAPGGVDMRTGRYAYSETDLTIGGDGNEGLALTRTMSNYVGNHANPFGNFSHNWDIFLLETRVDLYSGASVGSDYRLNVHMGGRSHTFEANPGTTTTAYKGDGPSAFLTNQGDKASASAIYTLRDPDGRILIFRPMGGEDCADQAWGSGRRRCAFVSEITEADGTHYSFAYDYNAGATGNRARLRQVTSSRGYALLLEGSGSRVTKACLLNLAHATVPSSGSCPVNAAATASYSYNGGSTKLVSVTGATGAVSSFTYTPVGTSTLMGFVKAGASAPWLTNTITLHKDEEDADQEVVDRQEFADGQTYNYQYGTSPITSNRPTGFISGGTHTDAAGKQSAVIYGFPVLPKPPCTGVCDPVMPDDEQTYQQTPGPIEIVDPLNRTTTFDYCDPVPKAQNGHCYVMPLQSFTDPEGMKTVLEYDNFRNVKKATRYPKPNSGLAAIVTSAVYDTANPKAATKPLSITDAKGNTTSFTYSLQHGGVLTETGSAVNGVQPQKRYTYAQRHAWISNGAGGYVQSANPVWLLTSMSFCRTSAATGNPSAPCATSGDEVITTYDYGPDSGPNNLLLRGTVVTADGQSIRTCQSYDARGNKISETSASANLSSCN